MREEGNEFDASVVVGGRKGGKMRALSYLDHRIFFFFLRRPSGGLPVFSHVLKICPYGVHFWFLPKNTIPSFCSMCQVFNNEKRGTRKVVLKLKLKRRTIASSGCMLRGRKKGRTEGEESLSM